MSGTRAIFSSGEGAVAADVQRASDTGASGDDRALAQLVTPGTLEVLKTVMPKWVDQVTNPRLLITPAVGGNQGKITLNPCLLVAAVTDTIGMAIDLSVPVDVAMLSALIAANASGSTRYDLLYVTINRTVPSAAQVQRRQKTTSGSAPTTQTFNSYDVPTATLGIVANVVQASPLASLPADTASAWNIGLAMIAVPNGYASAGAIAQSTITPLWSGGSVRQQRYEWRRILHFMADGLPQSPALNAASLPKLSSRWSGCERRAGIFKYTAATTTFELDTSIDWRRRYVRGRMCRAPIQAGTSYPFPDASTMAVGSSNAGEFSECFTGDGSAGQKLTRCTFRATGATGANNEFSLEVDNTGVLYLACTGGPSDNVNGDHWYIEVEASDPIPSNPV